MCFDLLTNNQSAKSLTENPVYHGRFLNIGAKWHFIRKRVELGMVNANATRVRNQNYSLSSLAKLKV